MSAKPIPPKKATLLRKLALIFMCWPLWAFGATPVATATIVDGEAVLIRDAARYALAEGVRLQDGDIVESAPGTATVRLEFANAAVLDIGPDTRVLIGPRFRGERRPRPASLYLLQGWTKFAVPAQAATPAAGIAAVLIDTLTLTGTTVEHIAGNQATVFQESGQGRIVESTPGQVAAGRALKGGESYTYSAGKGAMAPSPSSQFLETMPRAFRDTLPLRADRFKGQERAPKPLPAPRYADIEAWLDAEPVLRMALLQRWQRLAATPDFRKALIANMRQHPEWERILFPPKPPVRPQAASASGYPATR